MLLRVAFRQHGDGAVPALNTSADETLRLLKMELDEKVVHTIPLCGCAHFNYSFGALK